MNDWKKQILGFLKETDSAKHFEKKKYKSEVLYPALKEIGTFLKENGSNCKIKDYDSVLIYDRYNDLIFHYRLRLEVDNDNFKLIREYSSKEFIMIYNKLNNTLDFNIESDEVKEIYRKEEITKTLTKKYGNDFADISEELTNILTYSEILEDFTNKFISNSLIKNSQL